MLAGVLSLGLGSPAASQTASAPAATSHAKPPIFVLNSLDATISVVDPVSFKELRRLPTGKEPHHLYLTPDEKSLMVANARADSMTLVDPKTGQVQRVMEGIADPYQLRFSPDMKWFITAANRLNHVDIYRSMPRQGGGVDVSLVKRVPTGKTPSHINVDSKSTVAYVTMQDSDELIAIDLATQTPRWKVPVGKLPADIFLTPDDKQLMIGLTGDSYVEVYDITGPKPVLSKRIKTGEGAHAFRAWGDKRHVLLSNRVANTISKIDMQTMSVVATYPAPGGPDCMDLMSDGKTILVTSRWARKLTFIDTVTQKVIRQIPLGRSPHGVWTLDHAPRN
ncbi:MAG: YncE family protein [Aquabacterium sp.]|nr:YncE family protein [Aquabacterium sp.]